MRRRKDWLRAIKSRDVLRKLFVDRKEIWTPQNLNWPILIFHASLFLTELHFWGPVCTRIRPGGSYRAN